MNDQTITLPSYYINTPDLVLTFHDWRDTLQFGRKECDVTVTDGTNTIELVKYSPGANVGDVESYADDIIAYIDSGDIDKEPGEPLYEAHALWADKYQSPLEESEDE